jgi:hypothetical protein
MNPILETAAPCICDADHKNITLIFSYKVKFIGQHHKATKSGFLYAPLAKLALTCSDIDQNQKTLTPAC